MMALSALNFGVGRATATVAAAVLLMSCSIKENRSGCPCLLRFEFPSEDGQVAEGRAILSVLDDGGFSYSDTLDLAEIDGAYELRVPRTGVRVNLWSEEAAGFVGDEGLVIPFGDDCPYVRMFSSFVDTDCETCTETVRLSKNYCRLTVMMDESDVEWPFELNVCGNIDGYGIDGAPRTGEFNHYLVPAEASPAADMGGVLLSETEDFGEGAELVRELSLPRQTDSSLRLSVMENFTALKTFALGNYISQCGYDWTAADLQDIVVRIDYACTKISIAVGAWENSYDVDIEF